MKTVVAILTVVAVLQYGVEAYKSAAGTSTYLEKSALEKSNLIWSNCLENTTPANWFSKKRILVGIFGEGMCETIRTKGDQLPPTFLPWLFGNRKKYIHTVGAIAKVKWISQGTHEYTGLFKGATHGFARLSLAGRAYPEKLKTKPGIAVKFLRNKIDSGNFVAMYTINGQDSWNFFKNDFSNHVPRESGITLKLLDTKFATSTNNPGQVGLSDFSRYGENGNTVVTPKFPYKLIMRSPLKANYPDQYRHSILDDLTNLKNGEVIYKIYALDKPAQLQGKEKYIADLVLTSDMTTSLWADESMFFRHQDFAEDLMIHPEWDEYTDASRKVDKPAIRCPYE